jgi:quinolinate synthase
MEIPDKHFYKSCKLCRFMKMITLEGTLDSLKYLRYEIELTDDVREGAKRALEKMLELSV